MVTALCPQCRKPISLQMPVVLGQRVGCLTCNTLSEIIWLFPVSLDYIDFEMQHTNNAEESKDTLHQADMDPEKPTHKT